MFLDLIVIKSMPVIKKKTKVVIIGAGISGLSCAVNVLPHCDVIMFEARDRVGGRINTCRLEGTLQKLNS